MKIKLTENQFKRLEAYITEQTGDKFKVEVKFTVYGNELKYNGKPIFDIDNVTIPVRFDIEPEYRRDGIKSIFVGNFSGPNMVDVDVEYGDGDYEGERDTIQIPLNWENLKKDIETDKGMVTIDNSGYINLVNGSDGKLHCESIELTIYTL